MLGNDRIGDCTVAGAMHAVMLWRSVIDRPIRFTTLDATEDYFAITGGKDVGADMVTVAQYWRDTGFRDSLANRHKILAYLHVDAANLHNIDAACYLFDVVGLGVMVGNEEERAFINRQPWTNPRSTTDTYHYVPMVGKDGKYRYVVTWGGLQAITEEWFKAKVNEVVAVLSDENMISGKTLEGFDADALEADLEAL